ncbi:MAG: hypothetical protein ACTSVU_03255 [Promethearchaeota archaeon]
MKEGDNNLGKYEWVLIKDIYEINVNRTDFTIEIFRDKFQKLLKSYLKNKKFNKLIRNIPEILPNIPKNSKPESSNIPLGYSSQIWETLAKNYDTLREFLIDAQILNEAKADKIIYWLDWAKVWNSYGNDENEKYEKYALKKAMTTLSNKKGLYHINFKKIWRSIGEKDTLKQEYQTLFEKHYTVENINEIIKHIKFKSKKSG